MRLSFLDRILLLNILLAIYQVGEIANLVVKLTAILLFLFIIRDEWIEMRGNG